MPFVLGRSANSIARTLQILGGNILLAFQGSLSNFAGGVLILLIKPFKVGDYIIYTSATWKER